MIRRAAARLTGAARAFLSAASNLFYPPGTCPSVEMYCSETGELVATEETAADEVWPERHEAGYRCPHCGALHVFRWGPPTPVRVRDEP